MLSIYTLLHSACLAYPVVPPMPLTSPYSSGNYFASTTQYK